MTEALSPGELALRCYRAGLAACNPAAPLRRALDALALNGSPFAFLSLGKVAEALAMGVEQWASDTGVKIIQGLVISPNGTRPFSGNIISIRGDHPIPGPDSTRAADAIDNFITSLPGDAVVIVLISGGTSSLIAGPLPGITTNDLAGAFSVLLHSGLAVDEMNAVRKRITRWSAGRLTAALAPRRIEVMLISDVIGNAPSAIGSGPCHGDPWESRSVSAIIASRELSGRLSSSVLAALQAETLKPDDAVFDAVTTHLLISNETALAGIAREAARCGAPQRRLVTPLLGEARDTGKQIATEATRVAIEWRDQNAQLRDQSEEALIRPLVLYAGGETTVRVEGEMGVGGRSMELALAAARILEVSPVPVTILAAGTDGNDGNSGAAGAMVSELSWEQMTRCEVNPETALAGHDSASALNAIGSVIRTGETGVNVGDVVIVVV